MATKKEIRTEIHINASPEIVWGILLDFEKYPNWNPFIVSIQGEAKVGNKLIARMQPPDASGMTFKPRVLAVTPKREFRWLGHLLFPGLFDGEHIFELIANSDGSTTFIQREQFGGILVPLFKKMLDNNTLRGFEAMNLELKNRAERRDHK